MKMLREFIFDDSFSDEEEEEDDDFEIADARVNNEGHGESF
jgi:hypothetical protein